MVTSGIHFRWRRALIAATPVTAFFVFANWPYQPYQLKALISVAGYPFIFARWLSGEVDYFSAKLLLADLAIAVGAIAAAVVAFAVKRTPRQLT